MTSLSRTVEIVINLPDSPVIPPEMVGVRLLVNLDCLASRLKENRIMAQSLGLRLGQPSPKYGVSWEALAVIEAVNQTSHPKPDYSREPHTPHRNRSRHPS